MRLACTAMTCAALALGTMRASASFPGANGLLAYVDNDNIFVVAPDGTGKRQLTYGGTSGNPAWSPDGTRIAYDDRSSGTYAIYVADRDGGNAVKAIGDPAHHMLHPAWSPDDQSLAYDQVPSTGGRADLYVASADGSGRRLLREGALQPAWSPDGTRIAVAGYNARGTTQILTLATDGTDVRQLTHNNNGAFSPVWSPDGTRIAFTSVESGTWEIYVVNSDGTGERRLTNGGVGAGGGNVPYYDPAWSPDGTWIAFAYDTGGVSTLSVVRADGSGRREVTKLAGVAGTEANPSSGSPDWQPATALRVAARATTAHRVVAVTANITNTAPLVAHGARVAFTVRGPVALVSSTLDGVGCAPRKALCNLGDVAQNTPRTAILRLRVEHAGTLSVSVRVSTDTPDADTRDDVAAIRLHLKR